MRSASAPDTIDAVAAQNINWKKKSDPTDAYDRSASATAKPTGSSDVGAKAPSMFKIVQSSPGYIRLKPTTQ